jgi:hypothetical protein
VAVNPLNIQNTYKLKGTIMYNKIIAADPDHLPVYQDKLQVCSRSSDKSQRHFVNRAVPVMAVLTLKSFHVFPDLAKHSVLLQTRMQSIVYVTRNYQG